MKSLHWLHVSQRLTFTQICLLIYKALIGLAPIYLSDLLASRCYKRSIKSYSQEVLRVSRSRTQWLTEIIGRFPLLDQGYGVNCQLL